MALILPRCHHRLTQVTNFLLQDSALLLPSTSPQQIDLLSGSAIDFLSGNSAIKMRRCAIGHGCFVPPLSVSGPRGVAALCTDSMRIQTLDLEDHQEVEEAEGAEMTDC